MLPKSASEMQMAAAVAEATTAAAGIFIPSLQSKITKKEQITNKG